MKIYNVNGYEVAIHPMPTLNTNMRIIVDAGAADENEDQHGVAHFLEHMFFKGTKDKNYKVINRIAARLGEINAYTSRYQTAYLFTVQSSDFAEAAKLLLEMTTKPAFPEDEFAKEVGVILQECQTSLDSPRNFFHNETTQNLLGKKAGHWVLGSMDDIRNMTPVKMMEFLTKHYNPANMLIAISGNINPDDVISLLHKLLPEVAPNRNVRPKTVLNWDDFSFHHKSKQAIVSTYAPGITAKEELCRNAVSDVFYNGFGGGMHSMLFDRIREELSLCYSVYAHHGGQKDYGLGVIGTMIEESQIPLAAEEVGKLIKKVCADGFSDELLHIAKKNELFSLASRLESSTGVNALADCYFMLDGYNLTDFCDFEHRRKQIESVTNNDVIAFAREVYGADQPYKTVTMTQQPNAA